MGAALVALRFEVWWQRDGVWELEGTSGVRKELGR